MFYIYADDQLILNPLDKNRCVIQPRLTIEIGKAGGLEFSLPPNNIYYSKLRKLKTIVTVFLDEAEIFRGRVLSEERNFANVKKVYCEGDLAFLIDSVQKNDKYSGTTHDFFRKIIARHNERVEADKRFTVGKIGIENRELLISGQSEDIENAETGEFDYKQIAINASTSEWKTSYDYIQSCLIDYCGGYLRTRRVGNVTYIDLLTDFGHTAEQEIEFNKNLLDLTEEVTAEELFTVLVPLGDDNLDITSVNGGSDELVDEEAVNVYGRILKTHVFSGVSDPNTLLENARRFLKSNANIPVTITVKAIDMHLIESAIEELHVGDKVRVKSKVHNLIGYLTCTKIELDLENPGNNTYTFGNPKQSMTERYRKDIQKAEDAASGGNGGGGTGGAGAAAEASTSKANAWCTILKEQAFASIGASNERIDEMKNTLQTECGIDFDGNTGNVNIRSMYTKLSETGEQLVQQGAYIHLLQEDLETRIEMNVARVSDLEGVHKEHVATFTMFANDVESAIEAKADRFTVNAMKIELDALTTTTEGIEEDVGEAKAGLSATYQRLDAAENAIKTNSASITAVSNQIESKVSIVANSVDALGTRTASLEVKAGELESAIGMKADKVTVDAMQISLNALNTVTDSLDTSLGEAKTSISAVSKRVDSAENAIKTNKADITAVSNQIDSKVSIVAESVGKLGTRTASLEVKASQLESSINAQADKINLKADKTTLNSRVTTINGEIAEINTAITTIKKLIADEIEARKGEIGRLEAGTIKVTGLTVDNLYANNYVSAKAIRMNGATVATESYVNEKIKNIVTTSWIDSQGFATQSWVSDKNHWGSSSSTGKYWLYVNGSSKVVALGNHTHDMSSYATQSWVKEQLKAVSVAWGNVTGKPSYFPAKSHRHTFSFSKSIANGHTHKTTINGKSYTSAGVSTNATHKIEVSGNTGYTGG